MNDRAETFEKALEKATSRRGVVLLGICNVTPDSFSDGGEHFSVRDACAHVDKLIADGADIVDVGGESTRPGAEPVPASEQLARVLEVVRYASRKVPVSIDTTSPDVADACLEAGACMVNDVACGREGKMLAVAAKHRAAYVLMHSRGTPQEMRGYSEYKDDAYGDIVADVLAEWHEAAAAARRAGIPPSGILMDPGLGFAKNAAHSRELLRRVSELVAGARVPVLVGASRKSFLKNWDEDAGPKDREGASLAAALLAAVHGANALRVHDVRATRQAIDLWRDLAPPPPDTERKLSLAPPHPPSSDAMIETIRPASSSAPESSDA